MKPSIVVAGSSNTDMVIKAARLPEAGETILGGTFFMNAGGKGANQAVAAARLDGAVSFIAKTGRDIFGEQAVELFKAEGIDTSFVIPDAVHPSGVALITVDDKGENSIVVASGANAALSVEDINKAEFIIAKADVVLVQLEIPLTTVERVVALAAQHHKTIILNPAPACLLNDELLGKISILTPNEKEAEMLTGIAISDDNTALLAAKYLAGKGVTIVIITLGHKGALLWHDNTANFIPAPKVTAVDTTAAGDVFNGALAVAIAGGTTLPEAVKFANYAAALAVTKAGAQASAPYRMEVENFMKKLTLDT